MGLGWEEEVEICKNLVFKLGEWVCVIKYVRNDGIYFGWEIGEWFVQKGDIGYV